MSAEHVCTPHCEPGAHYPTPMSAESTTAPTLAEVLAEANVSGWYTASDHGCDGTEEVCMVNCPVPVQVQTSPSDVADAALAWVAARLDSDEVREAAKAAAKSESLDRFASGHLNDDAREWLAGFASRAALAEVKRLLGVTA